MGISSRMEELSAFTKEFYPFKTNWEKAKQLKKEFPKLSVKLLKKAIVIHNSATAYVGEDTFKVLRRIKDMEFIVPGSPSKSASPAEKEPWQMSSSEFYVNQLYKFAENLRKKGDRDPYATARNMLKAESSDEAHREHVSKAISEGKPVPSEVLAEYPDLENEGHLKV